MVSCDRGNERHVDRSLVGPGGPSRMAGTESLSSLVSGVALSPPPRDPQSPLVASRTRLANSPVSMTWEMFLEQLLEKLHDLHRKHTKADVLVMLGRTDKQTGEKIPPQVQVREFGL